MTSSRDGSRRMPRYFGFAILIYFCAVLLDAVNRYGAYQDHLPMPPRARLTEQPLPPTPATPTPAQDGTSVPVGLAAQTAWELSQHVAPRRF